eukprot:TRINITY_DN2929_c0_g2_i1.p1 TRINITY_DN2929_c0_g2~~TRINITY_DN2929_c0_g2_i1.p1  ORF type:complete len:313 (-),score=87.24 TRINITY_DN2929_c0_g2_i1:718-1656(-)
MTHLSGLVYKSEPMPFLRALGYDVIASGSNPYTSYFVADKMNPSSPSSFSSTSLVDVTWTRYVIARGVPWGRPGIDERRIWRQLSQFWPVEFGGQDVPLIAHKGVKAMAEELFEEVIGSILFNAGQKKISNIYFGGHSLGGSLALLLMLLLRQHQQQVGRKWPTIPHLSVHTFGSPPVLASSPTKPPILQHSPAIWLSSSVVAPLEWSSMDKHPGRTTPRIANGGMKGQASRTEKDVGMEMEVNVFVHDRDIIARAFLTEDPIYVLAMKSEWLRTVLELRQFFGGDGLLTGERFLYQTLGTLHYMCRGCRCV